MRIGGYSLAQIRKTVAAVVAALGILLVSALDVFADWISSDVAAWINTGIAVLGAVGVFLLRNAPLIDAIGTGENIDRLTGPEPDAP